MLWWSVYHEHIKTLLKSIIINNFSEVCRHTMDTSEVNKDSPAWRPRTTHIVWLYSWRQIYLFMYKCTPCEVLVSWFRVAYLSRTYIIGIWLWVDTINMSSSPCWLKFLWMQFFVIWSRSCILACDLLFFPSGADHQTSYPFGSLVESATSMDDVYS
jgi:hypothetical protein